MTPKRKTKPAPTNPEGRPPLQAGETRVGVTLSLTVDLRAKLDRISGGKPSEFARAMIASYPETTR